MDSMDWSPIREPDHNLILLGMLALPVRRTQTEVARLLMSETQVSVVEVDLSGSQTHYDDVSTKPAFDPQLAQMLYDAGVDVNPCNDTAEQRYTRSHWCTIRLV